MAATKRSFVLGILKPPAHHLQISRQFHLFLFHYSWIKRRLYTISMGLYSLFSIEYLFLFDFLYFLYFLHSHQLILVGFFGTDCIRVFTRVKGKRGGSLFTHERRKIARCGFFFVIFLCLLHLHFGALLCLGVLLRCWNGENWWEILAPRSWPQERSHKWQLLRGIPLPSYYFLYFSVRIIHREISSRYFFPLHRRKWL